MRKWGLDMPTARHRQLEVGEPCTFEDLIGELRRCHPRAITNWSEDRWPASDEEFWEHWHWQSRCRFRLMQFFTEYWLKLVQFTSRNL